MAKFKDVLKAIQTQKKAQLLGFGLIFALLGTLLVILSFAYPATDTTPPKQVILVAPTADSIVSGKTVYISANADDGVNSWDKGIAKMEYYLDSKLLATPTITPFGAIYVWDTTAVTDGVHTVRARAYDRAGNYTDSATINVTVQNNVAGQKTDKSLVFDATRSLSACNARSFVGTTVHNIFSMPIGATGDCDVKALTTSASNEEWWPRVSHDGKKVLYYETPKGVYESTSGAYSQTNLWVMNIDGTGKTLLIPKGKYWPAQGHAEWSPDDKSIVMFAGDPTPSATNLTGYQIYITDANGNNVRQVTDRTGHGGSDPSWSPDGKTIVFSSCPDEHVGNCTPDAAEIVTVASDAVKSKTAKRITTNNVADVDPYWSPDGKTIAWISKTGSNPVKYGIYKIAVGSTATDGTRVIDDGNINSKPEWSSDSKSFYFHRFVYNTTPPVYYIYKIGADGSGLAKITTYWNQYFNASYDFPSVLAQ